MPDREALPLLWALPFAGLLLSIAVGPVVAPKFWHSHFGKVAAAWTLALIIPFAVVHGAAATAGPLAHAIVDAYVPFLAILFALYTISGGICVRGSFIGTPWLNTALLAFGTLIASVMGTTGASMLLIRPLLTANAARRHRAHTVVFFIVLVGNVGGALTPLGDPPLFIGFVKGVDFFWELRNLLEPTALLAGAILLTYLAADLWVWRADRSSLKAAPACPGFAIEGSLNLLLIAAVVATVLISGLWHPGTAFDILGTRVPLENLLRDMLLVALAIASVAFTPKSIREHNDFHWGPIVEVAKIFAGIFVTVIPVLTMLAAGRAGALGFVADLVTDARGNPRDLAVFWVTGFLSSFLDNAPTFLVFFDLAGGNADELMLAHAGTLKAIAMGAVYFGALTYIGNAPNFMIKAVAEERGVAMPSFLTYTAKTGALMLPLLALIGFLYF